MPSSDGTSNVRLGPQAMQISRSVEPATGDRDGPGSTECPSDREDGVVATSQRQHILNTALALMAQRGVDGTSMRDLASAAGLNVASLYHYFPSKRELLGPVLEERGFSAGLAAAGPGAPTRGASDGLADLPDDILRSMLEV